MEDTKQLELFTNVYNKMVNTNSTASANSWQKSYRYLDDLERITKIIKSRSIESQQVLSQEYFETNGFYKRIILYYATLLKYCGILIPTPNNGQVVSSKNNVKKYNEALKYLDKMQIKSFCINAATQALINGCYYGIKMNQDKDSFVVLDLPSNYCRSKFKDYKGNDVIEFDLTYFNTIIDQSKKDLILKSYPKITSKAYRKFQKGQRDRYLFIPSDIGICFPMPEGRPSFLDIIPSIIRYENSLEIEMEREIEEIRKVIVQQIDHLNDGRLLFEPEEVQVMHEGTVNMLRGNPNLSVLTTYGKVDAITSKTSNESANNLVEKMKENIYSNAGVSSQLFTATGSTTLKDSILSDISFMFSFACKVSNFITNTINDLFADDNISFKYNFLAVSEHNKKDFIEDGFKLASSGYSWLIPAIAMDINQRDLGNLKDLENNVLKLQDKLIPLQSSYTQSKESAGAPAKEEENKAEQTIKNEEALDNAN